MRPIPHFTRIGWTPSWITYGSPARGKSWIWAAAPANTEESERRWGGTAAYAESQRRTSSYDEQQWLQIRDEAEQIGAGLAAAKRGGAPADGERAMDLAEQHRQHITRWFYDCSYAIHRGLGEMYVADPRFTASYEEQEPGLAAYIRDAIRANADRAEAA